MLMLYPLGSDVRTEEQQSLEGKRITPCTKQNLWAIDLPTQKIFRRANGTLVRNGDIFRDGMRGLSDFTFV
jgi:hypothetical protein